MNSNNQPLDKGRVAVVMERYLSNEVDNNGNQLKKNRYAVVGKATLWPSKQGSNMPNIELSIDTMPFGQASPVKMYVFWNSEDNQHQDNHQSTGNNQQNSGNNQQNNQQQPQQQNGSYGQQRGR